MSDTQTPEEMSTDIRKLTKDIVTIKEDVKNLTAEAVEVAKQKLVDAKKLAAEKIDASREVVSRNPLTSVAVAAGVGVLVGFIIGRYKD
jgi:ElaB/YqjD/DUF883 family membrane-anchored ribosome-binding protein